MGESVLLFFTNLSQNFWWVHVGLCRYLTLLIWPFQISGCIRLQTHAVIEMLFVLSTSGFLCCAKKLLFFIFCQTHCQEKRVCSRRHKPKIQSFHWYFGTRSLNGPPSPYCQPKKHQFKKCNGSSTWLVFSVQLTSISSACISVCVTFFFLPLALVHSSIALSCRDKVRTLWSCHFTQLLPLKPSGISALAFLWYFGWSELSFDSRWNQSSWPEEHVSQYIFHFIFFFLNPPTLSCLSLGWSVCIVSGGGLSSMLDFCLCINISVWLFVHLLLTCFGNLSL